MLLGTRIPIEQRILLLQLVHDFEIKGLVLECGAAWGTRQDCRSLLGGGILLILLNTLLKVVHRVHGVVGEDALVLSQFVFWLTF